MIIYHQSHLLREPETAIDLRIEFVHENLRVGIPAIPRPPRRPHEQAINYHDPGGGIGETPLDSHDSNIEVKVYNWCM